LFDFSFYLYIYFLQSRKEQQAAVVIQSKFRAHRQQQLYRATLDTAVKIQQRWRKRHTPSSSAASKVHRSYSSSSGANDV